jgi:hypothetical protein
MPSNALIDLNHGGLQRDSYLGPQGKAASSPDGGMTDEGEHLA